MKTALTVTALALFALTCTAYATGYHYHAPKVHTYRYHAPKLYTPHVYTPHTVPVRGYYRRNGTYVMPSHRTSPNATRLDNWSSKPNVNPYTGKQGTKNPYQSTCCGV